MTAARRTQSCRDRLRASVNIQTSVKHQKGETHDLSDFNRGLVAGTRLAALHNSNTAIVLCRVRANRKATVTQINTLYNRGKQKSISEHTMCNFQNHPVSVSTHKIDS